MRTLKSFGLLLLVNLLFVTVITAVHAVFHHR